MFTTTNPSYTPLLRSASSTCGVMFTNAIFEGMLRVRYSVCAFMAVSSLLSGRQERLTGELVNLLIQEPNHRLFEPLRFRDFLSVLLDGQLAFFNQAD